MDQPNEVQGEVSMALDGQHVVDGCSREEPESQSEECESNFESTMCQQQLNEDVSTASQLLSFPRDGSVSHPIGQEHGKGDDQPETVDGLHNLLRSMQSAHSPLLHGGGRPVPGKIYK